MPQIDVLSHFQGDALDAMVSEVLGDTSSLGSHVTSATNTVLSAVHYNEDQAKAAYSYVYKFLADQEGGGGAGWKPSMTGLHLTSPLQGRDGPCGSLKRAESSFARTVKMLSRRYQGIDDMM